MVIQALPIAPPSEPDIRWEPLPADYVLPEDSVENVQQPWLAAALTDALDTAGLLYPDLLVASNLALTAVIKRQTIVKAPDWIYVPQVLPLPEGGIRRSYTPQAEGAPVAIAMEFLSESDCGELSARSTYPYGKLYFYERKSGARTSTRRDRRGRTGTIALPAAIPGFGRPIIQFRERPPITGLSRGLPA